MDGQVFILYIIRKAVIVFITAFFVLGRLYYYGHSPILGILIGWFWANVGCSLCSRSDYKVQATG